MQSRSKILREHKWDIFPGTLSRSFHLCLIKAWSQSRVPSTMEIVRSAMIHNVWSWGYCTVSGPRGYTLSMYAIYKYFDSRGSFYNGYSSLRIYGASDMRDHLEPKLIWATPGQRGFPSRKNSTTPQVSSSGPPIPSRVTAGSSHRGPQSQTPAQKEAVRKQQEALRKAVELKQMLNNLEKVDDESRRSSLLDTLCSTDDILNLPLHPNPPSIQSGDLKVDLLKHQVRSSACSTFSLVLTLLHSIFQSQALQWCVEREYPVLPRKESDKPVQFWQMRKNGNKVWITSTV